MVVMAAIRKNDGPDPSPKGVLTSDIERLDFIQEEIRQLCIEAREIQVKHPGLMYEEEDYSAPRYVNG